MTDTKRDEVLLRKQQADRFAENTRQRLREERALIERRWQQREAERLRQQHRAIESPEAML